MSVQTSSVAAYAAIPTPPVAVLFDFDGVIVDSTRIKRDAYATVYQCERPDKIAQVLAYQRLNGGLGRREKFVYFERQLFGRPGDTAAIERLADAYHAIVYEAVLACRFVPGAIEFLQCAHRRVDLHVISGTPHDELVDIIRIRRLEPFFRSVYGSPISKRDAFARIITTHGYAPAATVAIGDATTEFEAATELDIPFLGIVPADEDNPFPQAITTLPSLQSLGPALRLN